MSSEVFDDYNDFIRATVSDLKQHLEDIEMKLDKYIAGTDYQILQDERESTKQCLRICEDVMSRIESLQTSFLPSPGQDHPHPSGENRNPFEAELSTKAALSDCREKLMRQMVGLQARLESDLLGKGPERDTENLRLQEQIDTGKTCLEICNLASEQASQHRYHVLENVSVADDSSQVLVSTLGDLIYGRGISAGNRSFQAAGSMSDETLQQISKDGTWNRSNHKTPPEGKDDSSEETQDEGSRQGQSSKSFGRHGVGRTLDDLRKQSRQ
jgi:hypothetical protein